MSELITRSLRNAAVPHEPMRAPIGSGVIAEIHSLGNPLTSCWPQPFPVRVHQHHRRHNVWRWSVNRPAQILKYVRQAKLRQRSSPAFVFPQSGEIRPASSRV